MPTAAIISFEEARQPLATTRARQQLHEHLARWWDRWEAQGPTDKPSLEAWTQGVFALRQELTGRITEAVVEQSHTDMRQQRTLRCPDCDRLLPARPAPPRTVHTMGGEVCLSRPYFDCISCQQGFAPLDDALQLSERRAQWDRQQAAARLAAEVPFKTAQELFPPLTGLSLSDPTIPAGVGELSPELGGLEVRPTAAEIGPRVAEMASGKAWRPVLVLASDGAYVPTRPEHAKGPARAAAASGPGGQAGRGNGRRRRAFASTLWSKSGSDIW